MLPQEIFDYKRKWYANAHCVSIHSDYEWKANDWCKKNLDKWQWGKELYTDVYEHTYRFESKGLADNFIKGYKND